MRLSRFRALPLLLTGFLVSSRLFAADPLIGKWQQAQTGERCEFLPDGTAVIGSVAVKWVRLKDGRLKLDTVIMGTPTAVIYTISIKGDLLTTTEEGSGKVETYQRGYHQSSPPVAAGVPSAPAAPPISGTAQGGAKALAERTVQYMIAISDGIGIYQALEGKLPAARNIRELCAELTRTPTPRSRNGRTWQPPPPLKTCPVVDAWGTPFHYTRFTSPRGTPAHEGYRLVSAGSDKRFEASTGAYVPGQFEGTTNQSYAEDIVLQDQNILRNPPGVNLQSVDD